MIKHLPGTKEYEQGAIDCLKKQLETAVSPVRVAKIESRIKSHEHNLEGLKMPLVEPEKQEEK